jgi:two-component system sensor histidine kinase RegB
MNQETRDPAAEADPVKPTKISKQRRKAQARARARSSVRRVVSTPLSSPYAGQSPRLNLFTLVAIRWIAIAGQAITIAIAIALGFVMPAGLAMSVVLISALVNLWIMSRRRLRQGRSSAWIGGRAAMSVLLFDLCQLTILLLLTGGITNPFAILLLAPVTVSAATLSLRETSLISVSAIVLTALVAFISLPLPYLDQALEVPFYYRAGLGLALSLAIAFTAFYLSNIAEQSRTMASALSSVHLALEREQRLSAIGGLAANAAHELGTPLATIAVVAKEMWKDAEEGSPAKEDAALLVEEAARCREILTEISRSKKLDDGASYNLLPMASLIDLAIERHASNYDCPVAVRITPPDGQSEQDQPVFPRQPELVHGLGNLVQNALQHAEQQVWVGLTWDASHIHLQVEDDGPGFEPELLYRLGDPYLKGEQERKRGGSSMGIGVFIATTLLNHCGATVIFSNRQEGGASVEVSLKRKDPTEKT